MKTSNKGIRVINHNNGIAIDTVVFNDYYPIASTQSVPPAIKIEQQLYPVNTTEEIESLFDKLMSKCTETESFEVLLQKKELALKMFKEISIPIL